MAFIILVFLLMSRRGVVGYGIFVSMGSMYSGYGVSGIMETLGLMLGRTKPCSIQMDRFGLSPWVLSRGFSPMPINLACVELTCFAQESFLHGIHLAPPADERAITALTQELIGFRNVTFQIWNEHTDSRVSVLIDCIKREDPLRLVTNSPGYGGDLGNDAENRRLDYLTPHTSRDGRHWEVAPREIALLLARFEKPVVDDEPARNGISENGGPKGATSPFDQILHIYNVWQVGGYPTYHHDMFQTGYGSPASPPSGIPDPVFNPYHRTVLEFLRQNDRYMP